MPTRPDPRSAKATAGAFGLPRLRLDMGRVFGGIVGRSEANLRSVIQTAEDWGQPAP